MVVSLRRMSAGDGYKHLLKTVVAGGRGPFPVDAADPLLAETRTPPGRWMGSGLRDLGLEPGAEVSERQLELLIGHGRHPITEAQLGRAYPAHKRGAKQKGVAGFDFSISIPKSASVLWAVSDPGTQAIIADAHHAAVRDVIDFMERELGATRTGAGASKGKGAVAQVEVTGFIAAAYDNWDSRAADPQLHTRVVVSNKVLTLLDGKWEPQSRGRDRSPTCRWWVFRKAWPNCSPTGPLGSIVAGEPPIDRRRRHRLDLCDHRRVDIVEAAVPGQIVQHLGQRSMQPLAGRPVQGGPAAGQQLDRRLAIDANRLAALLRRLRPPAARCTSAARIALRA